MIELWNDRSPRERALLIILAALCVVFILYNLVLTPMDDWRTSAARNATQAENVYDLVFEAASQKIVSPIATKQTEPSAFRTVLITTARDAGITLNYVNARSDDEVEASAENISSSVLFSWLQVLYSDHGIAVASADIARDTAGQNMVRTQIVFRSATQ